MAEETENNTGDRTPEAEKIPDPQKRINELTGELLTLRDLMSLEWRHPDSLAMRNESEWLQMLYRDIVLHPSWTTETIKLQLMLRHELLLIKDINGFHYADAVKDYVRARRSRIRDSESLTVLIAEARSSARVAPKSDKRPRKKLIVQDHQSTEPPLPTTRRAGSLRHSVAAWRRLGAPSDVVSWVGDGIPIELTQQPSNPRIFHLPEKDLAKLDPLVREMLSSGAIHRVSSPPKLTCPLFPVPKGTDKWRAVHNLIPLNKVSKERRTFRLFGAKRAVLSLAPGDMMMSLDLHAGYHHVSIHPSSQSLLGFIHRGVHYQFTVLPFGWSAAPFYFQKIMITVVRFADETGGEALQAKQKDDSGPCPGIGSDHQSNKYLIEVPR
ncbi:hypothetical protein J8273_0255 [Carpediemonas membranifera]|uniref:Reverse transcriptase domain-containing protein n=1 Tax=Carpediemonas membranifera TaxID=201153 RepID=A0A8J6B3P0_9EUKA|nr:hypothetical protein J8273_0255 [Carpediemonas membranifera]|eukprot:KAG9395043.1 hypothetical protein J8273_0255 [Carpediemonas membranifera]